MNRRAIILVTVAIFSVALGASADDQWTKQYTIATRASVRIDTNDAHITVTTWDRKEVGFRVTTEGWTIGDNDVRVSSNQSGDNVELTVRVPNMRWNWHTERRSVRIAVSMPREADLDAITGDGHMDVSTLSGRVSLRTGDGHVRLDKVRGDIRLHTGDGHIDGDALDGNLDVHTGDGRIRVTGRFDSLTLRTGDGHIEAEAGYGSKLARSWSLETNDGSIVLRVPKDLDATVDARTGDGRIHMGLPVTVSEGLGRSRVRGKLNAGGELLRLRSGDGSITIEP